MNEVIEVQFRKNGKRLRVKRQLPGGIQFDEPDPLERTVGIEFRAQNEITRMRMDSIRRIQGWQPGEFKLNMAVEDGSILLRGVNEHALPEGRYRIRLRIEEANTRSPRRQSSITMTVPSSRSLWPWTTGPWTSVSRTPTRAFSRCSSALASTASLRSTGSRIRIAGRPARHVS
jgi:hypothetical protein